MSRPTISATKREGLGKGANRRLRAAGEVPGVIYGNGSDPMPLALQPKDVVTVLEGPLGRNSVVDLTVGDATRMAIVKDYQVHPWKRKLIHVDFQEITDATRLTLSVPFKRTGQAPAEKLGARIEQHRDLIKIRCVAANIPEAIEFDMSTLEGEYAEVSITDIQMPEGVEPLYRKEFKLLRMKLPSAADLAAEAEAEAEGTDNAEENTEAAAASDEAGSE